MSALTIRIILAAMLSLVGLGGVAYSVAYIRGVIKDNAELRDTQAAILERMNKAEENLVKLDKLSAARVKGQGSIRAEVSTIQGRIQAEATTDESSRSYLDTSIPDGVRFSVLGQATADSPASTPGTSGSDGD